ncbi:DUF805 domain-containing protein [Bartonella sp. DGB1]|uniref:DUF805 domain-containing protein n=1 Tax=Bartonella sp. DGB1 TaxID=3239807 RepID=UPI0035234073
MKLLFYVKSEYKQNVIYNLFIDAIKNALNFKGRISRKDYWLTILSIIIVTLLAFLAFLILAIIFAMLEPDNVNLDASISVRLLTALLVLFLIFILGVAQTSLTVRRLHDLNRSGLIEYISVGIAVFSFILEFTFYGTLGDYTQDNLQFIDYSSLEASIMSTLNVIGLILSIIIIIICCFKGDTQDNKYGKSPYSTKDA